MDKLKYYWSKTNRWHRLLSLFLIAEFKLLPGGRLGFSCGDPALSHPFTGDTVSWKWLMAITVFLPVAFLLFVERKYHGSNISQKPKTQALTWYKEYLYGLLINLTIVEGLKVLVGAPRPHFFDTCQPVEAGSCQGSEYIASYTCTKAHWLAQSDRSFPSGHTSMAVHAAVFIAYYLKRRAAGPRTGNPVTLLQVSCILSAVFCAASRVYDHRHHWWDVMTGAAIAVFVLIYTILVLCNNFESRDIPKTKGFKKTEDSTEKKEANGVETKEVLETNKVIL